MILTTYYPNQKEEDLESFIEKSGQDINVLSMTRLKKAKHALIKMGKLSYKDDMFYSFLSALSSPSLKSEEYVLIDWEVINTFSSLEKELSKLKMTTSGFEIVEEKVKVQDFRLAPYMENLLKISEELKLSGTDRLFSTNPNLILPKILKGSKSKLIKGLETFTSIRSKFNNSAFTACIPIFNTEFAIK
jgi:RecG-like helicase